MPPQTTARPTNPPIIAPATAPTLCRKLINAERYPSVLGTICFLATISAADNTVVLAKCVEIEIELTVIGGVVTMAIVVGTTVVVVIVVGTAVTVVDVLFVVAVDVGVIVVFVTLLLRLS